MIFCNYCGIKIKSYTIRTQFRRCAISQCSRFLYYYKCIPCNKCYDYKRFKIHKQMQKETLQLINIMQR